MESSDSDSENDISGAKSDEDEGGIQPRASSDLFASAISILPLTLTDSEDSKAIDLIFEEVTSSDGYVLPESNSTDIRNQLDKLRAQKQLLEARVETLKIRLENAKNNIEVTLPCRRACSDTLLTSIRYARHVNASVPPATTTVASRQSIPFDLSQPPSPAAAPSASTPVLFSLFSRRGPGSGALDTDPDAPLTITASSHSILVLSHPAFAVRGAESNDSIPTSDTGSDMTVNVTNVTKDSRNRTSCHSFLSSFSPSLPPDGLWRVIHVDPETRMRRVRRRVTPTLHEEIVNYWENPRLPTYLHLRHSYPSLRESSGWIYEETEREALGVISTASLGPTSSGVASTQGSVASSTTFDPPPQPEDEEEETEYILQPMPSIVWDYVDLGGNTTVTPEHPFPRESLGRPPGLVMAYINSPPPAPTVDSPQQRSEIGRRRGFIRPITVDSSQDRRDLGFRARLRSELFFNVVFPVLNASNAADEEELATDTSEDDLAHDNGDADDEDDDDDDDGTIEATEGEDLSSTVSDAGSSEATLVSSSSSASSMDLALGNGDADSDISNASSTTSLPSDPNVTRPNWFLPSTTTIGGKYEYFRETQRPRPFPGHKFVVSVFGTEARQNNNSRPNWVPTYADRLESILTQYLESHNQWTQTDMVDGHRPNLVDLGSRISMPFPTFTAAGSLKMSRAQMESVNKVVSWSVDLAQRPDDDEDSVNANFPMSIKGDFDTSILTTRSCPGMSTDRDTGDQVQIDILAKPPHESEPISVDVLTEKEHRPKKRRRKLRVLLGGCCCRQKKSDPELPQGAPSLSP